ncbi:hypothetical protein [Leptospira adleri]|uniref:HEAT repeat domain-containing protein n=1 Tax=Leptospira adleri TaxID=2023186 RepID=A0A2M9YSP1_9LEPT|nr:hypothetical protein [Leptospira adleri]PJZ54542.1 hypothetical protein CH380_04625 [Leptospira adleri]PJZ62808.1 hypothetical protein CH376_06300 [Leptospira adleri]
MGNIFLTYLFVLLWITSAIQAEPLNPDQYEKIKSVVLQTGHIDKETLVKEVYAINPNPQEYLIAISKEPGMRVYALSQINDLIADFGGNSAKTYLESTISNENFHPSVRSAAVFAYGKSYYPSDKTHTENFLKQYQNHNTIGSTIQNTLKDLKAGKMNSVRFSDRLKKSNLEGIKDKNLRRPGSDHKKND